MTTQRDCESAEVDRFLSCTNCGWAFPIDSMFEDEDCYMCGGVLALRVMPAETTR
jgi:hypothetical protein